MRLLSLKRLWSATDFSSCDLTIYAEQRITTDVRNGVLTLCLVAMLLLGSASVLYVLLGFKTPYIYSSSLLTLLALHLAISSRALSQIKTLYLLGMSLPIIAATTLVLLAHKTGEFNVLLLSSVVLIFMLVPLVPWGLREACLVVVLVYCVFTVSTISVEGRFTVQGLWILQFLMLSSAITAITIVMRNVAIRRRDIESSYKLEAANQNMQILSNKDPLTGAWNRRFLEKNFTRVLSELSINNPQFHFAITDIDNFKKLNDTYGHTYGDLVLDRLVNIFTRLFPEQSYLIRMGGDEFAWLSVVQTPIDSLRLFNNELQADNALLEINSELPVMLSAGIVTVSSKDIVNLKDIYRLADEALYEAKEKKVSIVNIKYSEHNKNVHVASATTNI